MLDVTVRLPKPLRAGAMVTAAAGLLALAVPAHATAPAEQARQSLSKETSKSDTAAAQSRGTDTAPLRVAGKLSSAIRGAAAASRATRSGSQDTTGAPADSDEQSAADASPVAPQESQGDPQSSGPFKVVIPGQSDTPVVVAPAKQQSASTAATKKAEAPKSPVRTLVDRTDGSSPARSAEPKAETVPLVAAPSVAPAPATAPQGEVSNAPVAASTEPPSTAPTDLATSASGTRAPAASEKAAADSSPADASCIAGCYAPTSSQLNGRPARKSAGSQPAAAPARQGQDQTGAEQPGQAGIECLAGCDGIVGSSIPRTANPVVPEGQSPASSASQGTNRVTILRGSSRSKQYGLQ